MSKANQVEYHKRQWEKAVAAVKAETDRLIATKGKAEVGPDEPVLAKLVMAEIAAELKYQRLAK